MTAGIRGFKTKKALKEKARESKAQRDAGGLGYAPSIIETSLFSPEFKPNGTTTVVGPSPYDRRWFATITCEDGYLVGAK